MNKNFLINNNIRINPNISSPQRQTKPTSQGSSFSDIFNQEISRENEIKFSKHALARINDRKINFSADKMEKLTDAVDKANAKGARESLILMEDLALVVSIKNRTVITAVDGNSLKENVFTNIDSAVII